MKNNIKELRKDRKLRQEDLAEKLGVTRQTIIAIENNKYDPTLELAMKISELCIPVSMKVKGFVRSRMRESRTYGSVRGGYRKVSVYSIVNQRIRIRII